MDEKQASKIEACPFCPILLPDDKASWMPIGRDEFGSQAMVGSIRSCGWCAKMADFADCADDLIAQYQEVQA